MQIWETSLSEWEHPSTLSEIRRFYKHRGIDVTSYGSKLVLLKIQLLCITQVQTSGSNDTILEQTQTETVRHQLQGYIPWIILIENQRMHQMTTLL
jgi:hypothetical protein